jgi:hypothetical protein
MALPTPKPCQVLEYVQVLGYVWKVLLAFPSDDRSLFEKPATFLAWRL